MTSPARPAPWRTVLVVLVAGVGAPGAAVAAFAAAVVWSGCFIGCSGGGDHLAGGLLGLLALGLLAAGPGVGWWLRRWTGVLWGTGTVLVSGLLCAGLLGVF